MQDFAGDLQVNIQHRAVQSLPSMTVLSAGLLIMACHHLVHKRCWTLQQYSNNRLLLGTEAPVITPNGVDFSFLFSFPTTVLTSSTKSMRGYLSEKSGRLRCLNIMLVLSKVARGLAMPLPTMSLPTCRAPCSKIATLSPMLHPAHSVKSPITGHPVAEVCELAQHHKTARPAVAAR